jgi:hypothetical protein
MIIGDVLQSKHSSPLASQWNLQNGIFLGSRRRGGLQAESVQRERASQLLKKDSAP